MQVSTETLSSGGGERHTHPGERLFGSNEADITLEIAIDSELRISFYPGGRDTSYKIIKTSVQKNELIRN